MINVNIIPFYIMYLSIYGWILWVGGVGWDPGANPLWKLMKWNSYLMARQENLNKIFLCLFGPPPSPFLCTMHSYIGIPWWLRWERVCLQWGRTTFNPWVRKMATHASILVWKIPWTEEPGRLQYMGLQRVGHNWRDFTSLHASTGARPPWEITFLFFFF